MMICKQCKKEFRQKRKEQIYCSRSCASVKKGVMRKGQKTGARDGWKYKKQVNKDGYLMLFGAHHPYSEGRHMIAEHVMKMELHIGRRIKSDEVVHHKDGDKKNNDLKNLELMKRSDHCRLHALEQEKKRDNNGKFI